MLPVPMTLRAFRFLDPHTAPKPPCPEPLLASCTRQAILLRFSPAGPMAKTAGLWVVFPPFSPFGSSQSPYAPFPATYFQILSWQVQVSVPHSDSILQSLICMVLFRISIHTGLSALPSITIPSQPACLSIVENRPPKLLLVNQPIG